MRFSTRASGTSFLSHSIRMLARTPAAWVGAAIVAALLLVAVVGPAVTPMNPLRIAPPEKLQVPSARHPLGTDDLGRDLLSRIVAGARISLSVGILVLAIAMSLGVGLGLVAGYFGGWPDEAVMRTTDVFLAFPRLVLAIAIPATLRPGLYHAIVAVALSWWPWYTRLVRGQLLSLRQQEFVLAGHTPVAGPRRRLPSPSLPNLGTTV